MQINRFCASGLEAVNMAAAKVISGEAMFAIGGGVESMSRVPMGADGGAWPMDPAVAYKTYFMPQGIGADLIATKYGFSRADVDAYAMESQRRAARAWSERRFAKSVDRRHATSSARSSSTTTSICAPAPTCSRSEGSTPRSRRSARGCPASTRSPSRNTPRSSASTTSTPAAISSGIVDGAAAVLIGNRDMGEKYGIKPRAKILGMASIGSEPAIMLTGPTPVTEKLLKRLGMEVGDIDLFELNEAFASVVLRYMQALNIDHDKINVNGGAIAMGTRSARPAR